jgi:hypothetical protein
VGGREDAFGMIHVSLPPVGEIGEKLASLYNEKGDTVLGPQKKSLVLQNSDCRIAGIPRV